MITQIKAALFDLDGIIITGREKLFSERLAEEHNIPSEEVGKFFTQDFRESTYGRADLKEILAPYLKKWHWKGSVDDLLEYWFESESTKDEQVLAIVNKLRDRGIQCYIATRQEKYRMAYLEKVVGLKDHFDGTFVTHAIGSDKSEHEFFDHVLNELNLKPEEVLFFDDTQKNVDVAKSIGIDAYFYSSFTVLEEQANKILS